jgi:hypothetical protein
MNKQLDKIKFQDGATMDISNYQSTLIAKTMQGDKFMFMSTKKLTSQDNDKISRLIQQLSSK